MGERGITRFEDIRKSLAAHSTYLHIDVASLCVYTVDDLHNITVSEITRASRHPVTSFQVAICSSVQISGVQGYPEAWGAMFVPSEIRRVPGILARWI